MTGSFTDAKHDIAGKTHTKINEFTQEVFEAFEEIVLHNLLFRIPFLGPWLEVIYDRFKVRSQPTFPKIHSDAASL
jgi:hypothetical protein